MFPVTRPRRLRRTAALRDMVRETSLAADDFILPLFVTGGRGFREPVDSMPGVFRVSPDVLLDDLAGPVALGLRAIMLFGVLPDAEKDPVGTGAYADDGVVQTAIRQVKMAYPDLIVVPDICLCEYTDHGHCGIVRPPATPHAQATIDNDATLPLLARTALSCVRAGADMVAPSDMMDGRVGAIRGALDQAGFEQTPIMAYSAKYASAFYGPFREAAGSAPRFGDRRSYQMDPANSREALYEVELDLAEGADIVMVKPALSYLDIIRAVAETSPVPVAAYNVSGEYAMVKAAAANGWVSERPLVTEILTAIKRAGADLILSYHTPDVLRWLKEG